MTRDIENSFLLAVEPAMNCGETAAVLARLRPAWPPERLAKLLRSPSDRVAAAAAECLGMTGSMADCEGLLALLRHADDHVASAAEDALWRLWMSAGTGDANARLAVAVAYIKVGDLAGAQGVLESLTDADSSFAEAFHQLATIHHVREEYDGAEAAYGAALERNPYHFAAAAGLGHVRIERGDYSGALTCYREALRLNPRLRELGELVPPLEAAIRKRDVA